jgi:hypothetical protein
MKAKQAMVATFLKSLLRMLLTTSLRELTRLLMALSDMYHSPLFNLDEIVLAFMARELFSCNFKIEVEFIHIYTSRFCSSMKQSVPLEI